MNGPRLQKLDCLIDSVEREINAIYIHERRAKGKKEEQSRQ